MLLLVTNMAPLSLVYIRIFEALKEYRFSGWASSALNLRTRQAETQSLGHRAVPGPSVTQSGRLVFKVQICLLPDVSMRSSRLYALSQREEEWYLILELCDYERTH